MIFKFCLYSDENQKLYFQNLVDLSKWVNQSYGKLWRFLHQKNIKPEIVNETLESIMKNPKTDYQIFFFFVVFVKLKEKYVSKPLETLLEFKNNHKTTLTTKA